MTAAVVAFIMGLLGFVLGFEIASRTPLEVALDARDRSDLNTIREARMGQINHWQLLRGLGIEWSGPQPNRIFRVYGSCDHCVDACSGHWV